MTTPITEQEVEAMAQRIAQWADFNRAEAAALLRRLWAERDALRSLYQRAFSCAARLTNYVEDRPGLRQIERDMAKIEADYRAAVAQLREGTK